MISGPVMVLLIQKNENKETTVDDFRDLLQANESWHSLLDCTQSMDHATR